MLPGYSFNLFLRATRTISSIDIANFLPAEMPSLPLSSVSYRAGPADPTAAPYTTTHTYASHETVSYAASTFEAIESQGPSSSTDGPTLIYGRILHTPGEYRPTEDPKPPLSTVIPKITQLNQAGWHCPYNCQTCVDYEAFRKLKAQSLRLVQLAEAAAAQLRNQTAASTTTESDDQTPAQAAEAQSSPSSSSLA
ncbi:hypothetical protein Dda_5324 [Drechslerella dactyloides]|uniref:Uncharacterized protein n=1 Tax=Drechslerella dactyloides TaxID=74499 RepID=A0AAD6IWC6_DREDA|nr:hypothetical protein Dda_5324 [Drechslerella dactyloides]